MATTATGRPKPWQSNRTSSTSSFKVSSGVANGRLAPDVPDTPGIASRAQALSSGSPISSLSVPPRPSGLSSGGYSSLGSRYGSSYGGSSYGGYGGYGSSLSSYGSYGSSYGGGYGGYGSRYGSSYGSSYGSPYSRYGSGYGGGMGMEPGMLHSGLNHMSSFMQLVESFSSFSRLLDMNVDAMNGTLGSIARMVDVAGEFLHVVKTFALIKLLFSPLGTIWRYILGTPRVRRITNTAKAETPFDVAEFKGTGNKGWSLSSVIALVMSIIGIPIVIGKIWSSIQQRRLMIREGLANGTYEIVEGEEDTTSTVTAIADFEPNDEKEIPLRKGDSIKVLGQPFPDWWEGETPDGRRGLFPHKFVQVNNMT